ncbi:AAA family ATPase [Paraglaciecola chathamensis]|uniref:AAA family ATPase n=1 Tax=Paraglaciecola chathamensis TaxID=368405 RepID=UPI0027073FF5|nr:AAA family ATPase [Paraglaciecola chathamensis]MDO6840048.1 AAA family ATPase [Paraglaciecola chathamensis]
MTTQDNEPRRIVIFGNSGSGKSTLAKHLANGLKIAHLDLDTLAWLPTDVPERAPVADSMLSINAFTRTQKNWVIEGCYSDLLSELVEQATELIYMDLPLEACVNNARSRPWESHKYASKEAQDANLPMLIDWIRQYAERSDTFSQAAHNTLFEAYKGKKQRIVENVNY